MAKKVETTIVKLWGMDVGAAAWLDDRELCVFEFESSFLKKGLDLSPIHMNLEQAQKNNRIFSFPVLNKDTYLGLPGMLADSLPDKFGDKIIDVWLSRQGRSPNTFSPIERLCYTGQRGMGALEFYPPYDHHFNKSVPIEISELVDLTQSIMSQRAKLDVGIEGNEQEINEALLDILRVGTSAGGARAKAVIAMNKDGHVISGQTTAPPGYDYWILKFDGVSDLELGEPKSYGRIEYAYYLMAEAAGINMTQCQLLEENGRAHFLTKRFDRVENEKLHVQTLCGIAHYDYNLAGGYSYEQAFSVMRQLQMSKAKIEQQYRRMIFNVIARNQDDHTKNIAYIMDKTGEWSLSPAYDMIYSHNPHGKWTNQHQLSLNGKRNNFILEDLIQVGESISMPKPNDIINEVNEAVAMWPTFATEARIVKRLIGEIGNWHRKLS